MTSRIHPGAQLAGRAAHPHRTPSAQSAVKTVASVWPPSNALALRWPSSCFQADLPLLPSSSLLSFSSSARGPGRGGTAVGRDGPDPPFRFFCFGFFGVLDPPRKPHGARGPPSDQTPFFRFCFCFSLPWKLLGLQQGILQSRPHFGELRAYT